MTELPNNTDEFPAGIPPDAMMSVLNYVDEEPAGSNFVGKNILLDLRHSGGEQPDSERVPSDAVVIGYSAQDKLYTVRGVIPAIDEFPASPFEMRLSREEVKVAFLEKGRERDVYIATRQKLGADAASLSTDQPPRKRRAIDL